MPCLRRGDKPQDACGVFGVYAPGEDVAKLTYFGLFALQHRGQESAGIAVSDRQNITVFKEMGLVPQVFNEGALASLTGDIAIGHVRYSTTGSTHWMNAQPVIRESRHGAMALAHNGNIINTSTLRVRLEKMGQHFTSTSDTEVIAALLSSYCEGDFEEAIAKAMSEIEGAFSLVLLTENRLMGLRDPRGFRPLSVGKKDDQYFISSETCGLDIVGADFVRDVNPGEMAVIDENGLHFHQVVEPEKPSMCIFEFIYFARPDSNFMGQNLYAVRKRMGNILFEESGVDADIVVPVPDSGNSAAIGFSQASDIPYGEGLIKNRYIGRTFIQPNQSIRQLGIRLKLNPLASEIKGKKIVLVDDSIVRGNTSKKIVQTLRKAGAVEIHMRISSPPVTHPCYYGIDTAVRSELIASTNDVESIRKFIEADSLSYLSLNGLIKSTKIEKDKFCCACFDGHYPIEVTDEMKMSKFMLEEALTGIMKLG